MVDFGIENYSETYSERLKRLRKENRTKVMNLLGGIKCQECGCDIIEILEINHINGGGCKIRKLNNNNTTKHITDILHKKESTKNYNVLCKVCNIHHYVETILGIKGHKIIWDNVNNNSIE